MKNVSRKLSPIQLIMVDIKDAAIDIGAHADWLKDPQTNLQSSKDHLRATSDILNKVYDKLRELTGAHPCN